MRIHRTALDGSPNPTRFDRRLERLDLIKTFGGLLHTEGLFYPQLGDMLGEEVAWYRREMRLAANTAKVQTDRYKAECRPEALNVARTKLDLDVRCTGYEILGMSRMRSETRSGSFMM